MAAGDSEPQDLVIIDRWGGDFPVAELGLLPEGQCQSRAGYIDDQEVFATLWRAFQMDIAWLDFSCTDPIKIRNINANDAGNADGLMDYSHDRTRVWVEPFFDRHPLKPKETEAKVDRISRYPDSFLCR